MEQKKWVGDVAAEYTLGDILTIWTQVVSEKNLETL